MIEFGVRAHAPVFLRQHAREHGSTQQAPSPIASPAVPQGNPNVMVPRTFPSAIPNPAPSAPTVANPPNAGNSKDTDRLTGIERQQLRAQLREAKMREEQDRQDRQDREAKQSQRTKGGNNGGGKPNPPPAK